MNIYTVVPHIVKVSSNVNNINYFSIGHSLDNYFNTNSKIQLKFQVVNKIKRPSALTNRFDYYWGLRGNKKIYYSHPTFFPKVQLEMLFDNNKKYPSLTVNRSYYRWAKYKFENILPPGIHLMNIMIVKLLQKNILTLHSAAFSIKKNTGAYLIFGAPNTGKSYTVFSLINSGKHFMSEDMSVVDNDYVYSAPYISVASEYLHEKNMYYKIYQMIHKIPILGSYLPFQISKNTLYSLIEDRPYTTKSRLDGIIILEKSNKTEVYSIRKKYAAMKILRLNRMEYSYYKDDLYFAYSHFNEDFSIFKITDKEEKLIMDMLQGKKCYIVKAPTHEYYPELVNNLLSKI